MATPRAGMEPSCEAVVSLRDRSILEDVLHLLVDGLSFPLLFLTSLLQRSRQFDAFASGISVIFLLQGATVSCHSSIYLNC